MPMSQWLNAQALAHYVVGALAAAALILSWWLFTRKRARYVWIEDLERVSFIWIHSAFRERITVVLDKETGGEEQIDTLSQLRVKIYNATTETIENVTLRFLFEPPGARFLHVELDPPEEMQWLDDSPLYQIESESLICVSLPYLNPSSVFGEEQIVTLTVVADGSPRITKVVGGGLGWTAQYLSYEDRLQQEKRQLTRQTITIMIGAFIVLVIASWAFYTYKREHAKVRGSGSDFGPVA